MTSAPQHRGIANLLAMAFATLAAPLAWAFHSLSIVLLVPSSCEAGSEWPHMLVTLGAVAISAVALVVAYRLWRNSEVTENADTSSTGKQARGGFIALGGVFASAMFLLLILIETIPLVMLGACEQHP